MVEAQEQGLVEQLDAHATVELFRIAVLHRLAGGDVMSLDLRLNAPRQHRVAGQLGLLPNHPPPRDRGVRHGGQAFARHIIDNVQHPEAIWSWTKSRPQRWLPINSQTAALASNCQTPPPSRWRISFVGHWTSSYKPVSTCRVPLGVNRHGILTPVEG